MINDVAQPNLFTPPELPSWIQTVYPGSERIFGAKKTGYDLDGKPITIWAGWYPKESNPVALVDVWLSGAHIARATYDPYSEYASYHIDESEVTCDQFIAYIVLMNAAATGDWQSPLAHPLIDALYGDLDQDQIDEVEETN